MGGAMLNEGTRERLREIAAKAKARAADIERDRDGARSERLREVAAKDRAELREEKRDRDEADLKRRYQNLAAQHYDMEVELRGMLRERDEARVALGEVRRTRDTALADLAKVRRVFRECRDSHVRSSARADEGWAERVSAVEAERDEARAELALVMEERDEFEDLYQGTFDGWCADRDRLRAERDAARGEAKVLSQAVSRIQANLQWVDECKKQWAADRKLNGGS